jgi:hypothetical protein
MIAGQAPGGELRFYHRGRGAGGILAEMHAHLAARHCRRYIRCWRLCDTYYGAGWQAA